MTIKPCFKVAIALLCLIVFVTVMPKQVCATDGGSPDRSFDLILNPDFLLEVFPQFPIEQLQGRATEEKQAFVKDYITEQAASASDSARKQLYDRLFRALESVPSYSKMSIREDYRKLSKEDYMNENMEQLENTELGVITSTSSSIRQINLKVTSTKRDTKQHWSLGENLYFDIPSASSYPDVTITIPIDLRITYEWWHELWEHIDPGITVPHIYTIDGDLLRTFLAYQYMEQLPNMDYHAAVEILDYPYGRKFKPEVHMRTDIDIFDWDEQNQQEVKVATINKKEDVTWTGVKNKSGIEFREQAILDMQSRFQTINTDVPPMEVNIHIVEVEPIGNSSVNILPRRTIPDPMNVSIQSNRKTYKVKEILHTKTVVLNDVPAGLENNPFVIDGKPSPGSSNAKNTITAIDDPEFLKGYKFIASSVPETLDHISLNNYFVRYYNTHQNPNRVIYAYPKLDNLDFIHLLDASESRFVYPLGDFNIYFYYEKDAKPDFQAVSLEPGTEYSHPDKVHKGKATFMLKEEGYYWPHEADIFIKHNDEIIFEKRNVPFELGETKTYEFEWSGIELQDSELSAEIWPSIPTKAVPKPGETLEDAYPEDNVIKITVESGQVTLTVRKDPNLILVGTTDPEPGVYIVDRGTEVRLEAIPNNNWEFVRWKDDIDTTDRITSVIMDRSKVVTAEFARKQFKLTIEVRPPLGGTTEPWPGVHYVDAGSTVRIEAFPAENYRFIRWDGDASGTNLTTWVYMNRDKHVIAIFDSGPPQPPPDPKGLGNPILVE